MIVLYFVLLIIAFAALFKSADLFVDGACAVAGLLNIPKMVVGIIFVGLATTAPEFGVSVVAAIMGNSEFALGNAVGSVICDNGIALALAAVIAPVPILINCRILKTAAIFLLSVDLFAYLLARDGTIGRIEGGIFLIILVFYYVFLLKSKKLRMTEFRGVKTEDSKQDTSCRRVHWKRPVFLFSGGLIGVAITSTLVNWSCRNIADHFSLSKTIIGLTLIAVGTSLPEISTCVTAARKGEGEIAVGNIIGADVLNILWIIGVSSLANPISVEQRVVNFSFPFMILIVSMTLLSMRLGCRLGKAKGIFLFSLYLIYLLLTLYFFT